jgi:hypothetical protein
MLVYAVALALIAAVVEHFFGLGDPWKKIIVVGVVILLVLGILLLIFPGLLPIRAY